MSPVSGGRTTGGVVTTPSKETKMESSPSSTRVWTTKSTQPKTGFTTAPALSLGTTERTTAEKTSSSSSHLSASSLPSTATGSLSTTTEVDASSSTSSSASAMSKTTAAPITKTKKENRTTSDATTRPTSEITEGPQVTSVQPLTTSSSSTNTQPATSSVTSKDTTASSKASTSASLAPKTTSFSETSATGSTSSSSSTATTGSTNSGSTGTTGSTSSGSTGTTGSTNGASSGSTGTTGSTNGASSGSPGTSGSTSSGGGAGSDSTTTSGSGTNSFTEPTSGVTGLPSTPSLESTSDSTSSSSSGVTTGGATPATKVSLPSSSSSSLDVLSSAQTTAEPTTSSSSQSAAAGTSVQPTTAQAVEATSSQIGRLQTTAPVVLTTPQSPAATSTSTPLVTKQVTPDLTTDISVSTANPVSTTSVKTSVTTAKSDTNAAPIATTVARLSTAAVETTAVLVTDAAPSDSTSSAAMSSESTSWDLPLSSSSSGSTSMYDYATIPWVDTDSDGVWDLADNCDLDVSRLTQEQLAEFVDTTGDGCVDSLGPMDPATEQNAMDRVKDLLDATANAGAEQVAIYLQSIVFKSHRISIKGDIDLSNVNSGKGGTDQKASADRALGASLGLGTKWINVSLSSNSSSESTVSPQSSRRQLSSGSGFDADINTDGVVAQLQNDPDNDGIPSSVDSCPLDEFNDADSDGLCASTSCFDKFYVPVVGSVYCVDLASNGTSRGVDCVADDLCSVCSCSCYAACHGAEPDPCPNDPTPFPASYLGECGNTVSTTTSSQPGLTTSSTQTTTTKRQASLAEGCVAASADGTECTATVGSLAGIIVALVVIIITIIVVVIFCLRKSGKAKRNQQVVPTSSKQASGPTSKAALAKVAGPENGSGSDENSSEDSEKDEAEEASAHRETKVAPAAFKPKKAITGEVSTATDTETKQGTARQRKRGVLKTAMSREELRQQLLGGVGLLSKALGVEVKLLLRAVSMWDAGKPATRVAPVVADLRRLRRKNKSKSGANKSPAFVRVAEAIAHDLQLVQLFREGATEETREVYAEHEKVLAAAIEGLKVKLTYAKASDGPASPVARSKADVAKPLAVCIAPGLAVLRDHQSRRLPLLSIDGDHEAVAEGKLISVEESRGIVAYASKKRFKAQPVVITEVTCSGLGDAEPTDVGGGVEDNDKSGSEEDADESKSGGAKKSKNKNKNKNKSKNKNTDNLHLFGPLGNLHELRHRFHQHNHVLRVHAFLTLPRPRVPGVIRIKAEEHFCFTLDSSPIYFQRIIGRRSKVHYAMLYHLCRQLVLGLQFLHRKRIMHMHVAPCNIVICRQPRHRRRDGKFNLGTSSNPLVPAPWVAMENGVSQDDSLALLFEATLKIRLSEATAHVDTAATMPHIKRILAMKDSVQPYYSADMQMLFSPNADITIKGGSETKRRFAANDVFGAGCVISYIACGRRNIFDVADEDGKTDICANINAARTIELKASIRNASVRKLIRQMIEVDHEKRISLSEIISKSTLFKSRLNCQLGRPPVPGDTLVGPNHWLEASKEAAVQAAQTADAEVPEEDDLAQMRCRDHVAQLELVPSGHMRQLKHLATIDERVKQLTDIDVADTSNTNEAGQNAASNTLAGSELLLGQSLTVDEIYALVAFTFESGRDVDTSNVFLRANEHLQTVYSDPAAEETAAGGESKATDLWSKLRADVNKQKQKTAARATAWAGYFHYLSAGLAKLPYYKGTVFVGAGEETAKEKDDLLKKGKIIRWNSFRTAGSTADVAKAFVKKKRGIIFRISLKAIGGVGLGVTAFSSACDGEVLLLPGIGFAVTKATSVDESDGYRYVDLQEVVLPM